MRQIGSVSGRGAHGASGTGHGYSFQLLFRRLAVLLIKCKEENGSAVTISRIRGNIVAQAVVGQKVGGRSHQRSQHKKISWRRVRPNTTLLLTSVKSLCDISHGPIHFTSCYSFIVAARPLMGVQNTLCHAARLEQAETQQRGVGDTRPDCPCRSPPDSDSVLTRTA